MRSLPRLPSPAARTTALCAAALCFLLAPPRSVLAEIFQWKDSQGRLHFTQDLNQVPPAYRAQAEAGAEKADAGREIQRYESRPAALAPSMRGKRGARDQRSARSNEIHRIRVQKAGSSMRVNVRLNRDVVAPFIVDTGASDVVISESVARQLGLDLESARTKFYGTANGTVQQPVVTLATVELGGARADDVPASVSRSMRVGLLGLSFFNHFRYKIDPAAGMITLRPNGLAEKGKIRGGRSESQWRNEFEWLSARMAAIEAAREATDSGRKSRRDQLDEARAEVERQLEVLEGEADEAHVPMSWRH
jgi:clan AA aspartic protease (TIGR02281 family)